MKENLAKHLFGMTYKEEEIAQGVLSELKRQLPQRPILLLTGPLGAGKTTLVQSFLRSIGVTTLITSPTFSYVNHYEIEGGGRACHFDLYRLNSLGEFCSMGFDRFLDQCDYVFIEWPEIVADFCREKHRERTVFIELSYDAESHDIRKINVSL